MLGLVAVVAVPSATAVSNPTAIAARRVSLNLNVNMHLVGRAGHTFNEKGTASGSFSGTVAGRFTSAESSSGTAVFTIYDSRGGTLNGRATTRGHVVGAIVHFEGTLAIVGGNGRWAHAHSTSVHFKGVVDRRNFHAKGQLVGSVSV